VKFDPLKTKLAQIETAIAALRPHRKVLRVIVDQGEEAEEKMQAALAEHLSRHPEDAGRAVSDFDWITRLVVPDPRCARLLPASTLLRVLRTRGRRQAQQARRRA